jgi:hypothetical protein
VSLETAIAQIEFWVAIPLLLVAWPMFESARRRRWGWFWVIVFMPPVAGAAWVLVGRWRRVPVPVAA